MATLQAVVDIQDRASQKFDRIRRSAETLWATLDRVDKKLTELERKIILLNRQRIRIPVSLDTMMFDAQYAALRARMAAIGGVNFGPGGGLGAGPGGFASIEEPYDPATVVPRARRSEGGGIIEAVTPGRRRLRINRLDNGVIGFFSVIATLMGNLFSASGILRKGFEALFSVLIHTGIRVMSTLGLQVGPKVVAVLGRMGQVAATGAASLVGLTAAATVLVLIMTTVAYIIGVVAGVLASLAVPIAGIATGITALVGAIGLVFFPMFKWISDTKQLVDQEAQLEERLSKQTKGTKEYNNTLKELTETRKKLAENGGGFIFKELKSLLDELKAAVFTDENKQAFAAIFKSLIDAVKPLLPIITELVRQFAFVMNILAEEFRMFTNSKEGQRFFRELFESALPVVLALGRGIGQLAKLFGALSIAAAPITEILLADFANWLGKVADYLRSPKGMDRFQKFLENMYPVFKQVVIVIKDFFVGLAKLGEKLAPETLGFLEWLGRFGEQFASWVDRTINEYGPDLITTLQTIGNLIKSIWDISTNLVDAFGPVLEILLDMLQVLTEFVDLLVNNPIANLMSLAKGDVGDVGGWIEKAGSFALNRLTFGFLGASGAVVTQPTVALIGESGPEMVAPLHSAKGARKLEYSPDAGSGGISINQVHVHGVQNLDQFVAEIKKQVSMAPRASGQGMTIG